MLKKKGLFGLFDGEIAGLNNLIVTTVIQGIYNWWMWSDQIYNLLFQHSWVETATAMIPQPTWSKDSEVDLTLVTTVVLMKSEADTKTKQVATVTEAVTITLHTYCHRWLPVNMYLGRGVLCNQLGNQWRLSFTYDLQWKVSYFANFGEQILS